MTNDRYELISNLLAEYHTHFPEDAIVVLAAEQDEGSMESTITMVGNISPQDMHAMITATAAEAETPTPQTVHHHVPSFSKH